MTERERRFGLCPFCSRYTGVLRPDCTIPECVEGRIEFRPWDQGDIRRLIDHWSSGRSTRWIAIELRRSIPDVLEQVAVLRLPSQAGPPSYVASVHPIGDSPMFGARAR